MTAAMQQGSTPVPDPTLLTTQASEKAVAGLKELLETRIDALANLQNEKFISIGKEFVGRDVAVAAALQAQKEAAGERDKSNAAAISKSEAATSKQIDAISAQITATAKASDDKISDLKDRLTVIESLKKGGDNTWALIVAGVGAVAGLAGIAALVLR